MRNSVHERSILKRLKNEKKRYNSDFNIFHNKKILDFTNLQNELITKLFSQLGLMEE